MPQLALRRTLHAAAFCVSAMLACGHVAAKEPASAPAAASAVAQPAAASAVKPDAKQRTLWIDVRTSEEYAQGHLEGAINIPLDQIAQRIASQAPDKDMPIAVYCRSGNRSEQARQILQSMGYSAVTNEGGYADLMRRGVKAQ